MNIYKNVKRAKSCGTQAETPHVNCVGQQCIVTGYQHFTITPSSLIVNSHYKGKFECIKNILRVHAKDCKSAIDLGSSTGLVAFLAAQAGFEQVFALDHDLDCLKVIHTINSQLEIKNVNADFYSFGQPHEPVDFVVACALIHWVYSCTALYGNFDAIISYLRNLTKKYLLIEWVDPADGAIKSFRHTSFNRGVIKEPYTKENFLKSCNKFFSTKKIYNVTRTRELYLCTVNGNSKDGSQ